MKKVFSSHSEVAHVWASRTQEFGTAGNVSFQGDKILSYHWWTMAQFYVTKSGKKYVFIRNWSYSSSTGKHLGIVQRAIPPDYERIYVCGQTGGYYGHYSGGLIDHESNIAGFISKMKISFTGLKGSKYPDNLYNNNQATYNALKKYCSIFRLKVPKEAKNYLLDWDNIQYLVEGQLRKNRDREYNSLKNQLASNVHERHVLSTVKPLFPEVINEWRRGKRANTDLYIERDNKKYHIPGYYLRVVGDEVESNHWAKVPVQAAKILLQRIRDNKPVKGFQVGRYTVISINGSLKIGCHEFKRSEIDNFCAFYGW